MFDITKANVVIESLFLIIIIVYMLASLIDGILHYKLGGPKRSLEHSKKELLETKIRIMEKRIEKLEKKILPNNEQRDIN